MANTAFGVFDWIDRGPVSTRQLYQERLALLQAADAAGFYCYHLAEHHATPLGMAPSPGLFLMAAAELTRRIRLGPLVYLLPLYDPLRLLGEICMLDQFSGGRLDLGVGRGVSPYELRHYGIDPSRTRAIFDEALATLVAGMTGRRLSFQGQYYRYNEVPVQLEPLQRPYPPLWYPTNTPESIHYAARHGFNYVSLGPAATARTNIDAYWTTWNQHRTEANRLNGHVALPKVGVMRQIVVAESDAEARSMAKAAHDDWFRSITQLWHEHDDHSVDQLFAWDGAVAHETLLFGAPARVRDQVARLIDTSGCNYVIGAFAWGSLRHDQALRSLRLFAEEIMPAFM